MLYLSLFSSDRVGISCVTVLSPVLSPCCGWRWARSCVTGFLPVNHPCHCHLLLSHSKVRHLSLACFSPERLFIVVGSRSADQHLFCYVWFLPPFPCLRGQKLGNRKAAEKGICPFQFTWGGEKNKGKKEWITTTTCSLFLHTCDLEPFFLFNLCFCTTPMSHGALGTPAVGFVQAQNVISKASTVHDMSERCSKYGGCCTGGKLSREIVRLLFSS